MFSALPKHHELDTERLAAQVRSSQVVPKQFLAYVSNCFIKLESEQLVILHKRDATQTVLTAVTYLFEEVFQLQMQCIFSYSDLANK